MLRLPIWMMALSLTGCFGNPKDDNDDEDENADEWGNESNNESWGGGGGSAGGTGTGGGSGATTGGEGSGGGGPCEVNEISLDNPETDGGEFYYRDHVSFVFDGIDEDATIVLMDAYGNDIDGSTYWTSNRLSFAPTRPLNASANYAATLTHCAGETTVDFVTTASGVPLSEDVELAGKTYVVNLDDADFVKPPGVGGLLLGLLEQHLLLGIMEVSGSAIEMMGAVAMERSSTDQNTCEPTIPFPTAADFTDSPHFSIGADTTELSVSEIDINIRDWLFTADFSADGSKILGGVLTGKIDAADLTGAMVGTGLIDDEDPRAVCELIATFGVACEDCGDGREECLDVHMASITAEETGTPLIEVETCDVETCDEGCE